MAEFGWAYVVGTMTQGGSGAVQVAQEDGRLSGSTQLKYSESSPGLLQLTGSLFVSGSITANQYNVNVVNETVTNLSSSGNTKFGNSIDDTHIFTGSINLSGATNPLTIQGLQVGSKANESSYLALDSNNNFIKTPISYPVTALNNQASGRLVSIGDTTTELNGQANLTFDGSTLTVVGDLSSSVGISSSVGQFTELTGSRIKGTIIDSTTGNITTVNSTTVSATNLGGALTTATQGAITSVGILSTLRVSGDLSASSLFVSASNNRIGVGTNSPEKKLEIYDKSDQLRLTYSKYIPFLESNVHTDLLTNSDGYLVLNPSGQRVGIGTSSPSRMLDVDGHMRVSGNLEVSGTLSARVTDFIVSADTITLGDSRTDTLTLNASSASIPNNLNFDSNTWVLDASNNRVGIGTEHPDYTLDVGGNIGVDEFIYHNDDDNTYIRYQADQIHIKAGGRSMIKMDEAGASSVILLNKDGQATKVAIGTETPETDLHVSGSVIITGDLAVTGSITGSSARITTFTDGHGNTNRR